VAGKLLAAEPIEWRSRPWRGSTGAIGLVAALFAGLFWYSAVVAHDGVWAAITVLAAFYVLSPLTVPVRYRMDDGGLARRSWLGERRFSWPRFATWQRTPNGRIAILRFAGKGAARWTGGMSLFLPEEPLAARVLDRLAAAIGPESMGK
jgi:hypothetical protein